MKKPAIIRILPFVFLAACSDGMGPSRAELEGQLALRLPHQLEMGSFSVEASENIGTKVEPLIKSRFKAEVRLKEDTFERDHQEGEVAFLRPAAKKGERRELYGIASAVQKAGSWQIIFDFENSRLFDDAGNPLGSFTGRVIVIGSSEEKDFRKEQAEAAKQAELAAKAVVQARLDVITAALTSGRVYAGEQKTGTNSMTPTILRFQVRFLSFDKASGRVTAENRWFDSKTGALKAPNHVEGLLVGDSLRLTERVRNGENGQDFSISYSFALAATGDRLDGKWRTGSGGEEDLVNINLK